MPIQTHAPANPGTLQPGQMIRVEQHTVTIERYLSQGGYAHVYICQSAKPIHGQTRHVLKRIATNNAQMLKEVGWEVQVMRLLAGHSGIVNFIAASAFESKAVGGYETFILMELCPGGGLIDFMNARLRERLSERTVLDIMASICEAVAGMHSLNPPLLHRDLKVENVLLTNSNGGPGTYRLCDFGSAAAAKPAPRTLEEIKMHEDDINKHTTLQYRSPEMLDVSLRKPITEKADVWALGVLLYKLCFFTTPFEAQGNLAILNVIYSIPKFPQYSPALIGIIQAILKTDADERPTVLQLLAMIHQLRGTVSTFRPSNRRWTPEQSSVQPPAPKAYTPVMSQGIFDNIPESTPNILPGRRGRPEKNTVNDAHADAWKIPTYSKPAASNPIDGFGSSFSAANADKFPSINDFSSSFNKRHSMAPDTSYKSPNRWMPSSDMKQANTSSRPSKPAYMREIEVVDLTVTVTRRKSLDDLTIKTPTSVNPESIRSSVQDEVREMKEGLAVVADAVQSQAAEAPKFETKIPPKLPPSSRKPSWTAVRPIEPSSTTLKDVKNRRRSSVSDMVSMLEKASCMQEESMRSTRKTPPKPRQPIVEKATNQQEQKDISTEEVRPFSGVKSMIQQWQSQT